MNVSRIDLQPVGGIAGDMFAAAMFDAFPDLLPHFEADMHALGVAGVSGKTEQRLSCGLAAKYFSVTDDATTKPPRTLPAVISFLKEKSLDAELIDCAVGIYSLLAAAEATVHGKTTDTIHFHEVSDWDSMVDIIAAAGIISRVACPYWRLGPLPLGGGTVSTAHGEIPVPAPATLELLKGFDWVDDGIPGERVTPTGAAIVAYLQPDKMQQITAATALHTVGIGCGARELTDRANILRVSVFRATGSIDATPEPVQSDTVCKIEFDIDDMTGEELAAATDVLRNTQGVIDICTIAIQAKKGRPATELRLLVKPKSVSEVVNLCFTVTTTLGVRINELQRHVLVREEKTVDGYRVKVAHRPGGITTSKAASDDLKSCNNMPERRATAERLQKVAIDE